MKSSTLPAKVSISTWILFCSLCVKLQSLLAFIKDENIYREVTAHLTPVSFQKWGLLHSQWISVLPRQANKALMQPALVSAVVFGKMISFENRIPLVLYWNRIYINQEDSWTLSLFVWKKGTARLGQRNVSWGRPDKTKADFMLPVNANTLLMARKPLHGNNTIQIAPKVSELWTVHRSPRTVRRCQICFVDIWTLSSLYWEYPVSGMCSTICAKDAK